MELMDMYSARSIIDRGVPVPETILFSIVHAMLRGLEYLHNTKNTCHRDIKPDNVLLNSKGEIKLSDFGICKLLDSDAKCSSFVGTIKYMSPERVVRSEYGLPGDIWSLGLVVYELAAGCFPYPNTENIIVMLENFEQEPPLLPNDGRFSPQLIDFVYRCLQTEPSQRFTVTQLLQHPWFVNAVQADVASWVIQNVYSCLLYTSPSPRDS